MANDRQCIPGTWIMLLGCMVNQVRGSLFPWPLLIQLTHTWVSITRHSLKTDAWWVDNESIRQKETDILLSDALPGSPRSSVFGKTLLVGREREEEGQDKCDSDTLNDDTKTERETETAERMLLLTRAVLYCETSMFIVFKEHKYARTKEREYKTELDQHQMTQEMLRGEIQVHNTEFQVTLCFI